MTESDLYCMAMESETAHKHTRELCARLGYPFPPRLNPTPPSAMRCPIRFPPPLRKAMKHIAAAFVKAQQAFGPALKEKTNPAFKSKYADLQTCIAAVIDALNSNGIAMIQQTHEDATGATVETVFLHETGERLSSGRLHIPASNQGPQGYGSALTYARRYSLMAACGIAPEDDDGEAASRRAPDVASILRGLSGAHSLEILRTNYEAAMQMLDTQHHEAIKKAATARKAELTPKVTA